jgi:hypothetical protein
MDMQHNVYGSDLDKYFIIEQKNLIQLLKLSIKNFIDFALSLTSGLEEEEGSLYQLFVVLEQVLRNFIGSLTLEFITFFQ